MIAVLNAAAALLGLAALFGFLNYRFLKLPQPIGLVIIALLASLAVIGLDAVIPGLGLVADVRAAVIELHFSEALMQGMLSFLLFAGALHVDLGALAARKWAIGTMASVGVLISTALVGFGIWGVFALLGISMPLIFCLVFGALISPTDPVAVLGILKTAKIPKSLEAKIAGESLFNDGIGVVVFIILAAIALGGGHGGEALSAGGIALLFAQEALGGAALGLATGGLAFYAIRAIDQHNLEVIITLTLVMVTYQIATVLHLSGPIAVVVAGLLIGNHGTRLAMSETTRLHLTNFWTLLDEILNAVLFLLIGIELLVIPFQTSPVLAALIAIPLVLAARFVSVGLPITLLGTFREFTKGAVPVLTWGGIRGGISVALVLSLPNSPERDVLLTVCYGVVLFSIVVQGLTIGRFARRIVGGGKD